MKRTKVVSLATILLLIGIFFMTNIPGVLAWDDCPFGLVDDPYPGECARYIDTDDDGICDHSQPAPEDRVALESSAEDIQEEQIENETVAAEVINDTPTINNTKTATSNNSEPSVSTNTEPTSSVDDTKTTPSATENSDESKEEKSSALIKGIAAIFAPLILILGYALWQRKKA